VFWIGLLELLHRRVAAGVRVDLLAHRGFRWPPDHTGEVPQREAAHDGSRQSERIDRQPGKPIRRREIQLEKGRDDHQNGHGA
jgi:hypothetical protein